MRQTVFIIEDDVDTREMIAKFLELEGYHVELASNGRQALDRFNDGADACVILLDLMMPVMDGWQFRREQKLDADIAGIPLVVITATGKRPVLIDAAELVMKPLDLTQLFEAIARYCQ